MNVKKLKHLSSTLPKTEKGEEAVLSIQKLVHDLNNQLTAITCYTSLLSRQSQDSVLKEGCRKVVEAAQKAAEMGNKIAKLFKEYEK